MAPPKLTVKATVLDSPKAWELAAFYRELLGWSASTDEPDWVTLDNPAGGLGLSFQSQSDYRRPAWPAKPTDQQMMTHLDILVEDLEAAVAHAVAVGAVLADYQPQDGVRVCFDPAGHPFCLYLPGW